MNKYIKTDIEQGITFLKIAINNTLANLETGEEKEIKFEYPIPLQLIISCAKERGWTEDSNMNSDWTNGWQIDYWYSMIHPDRSDYLSIDGSLLDGNTSLRIINDY